MKITEHLKKAAGKTLFSFEIIPPKKGNNIQELYDNIDPLMEFKPPFIDVTTSREESIYIEKDGKRATVYDDIPPSELTIEKIDDILKQKNNNGTSLGAFPNTGEEIFLKNGRYGTYLQMGEKMKSLPPNVMQEDIDISLAIEIISLPKQLGTMPESQDPILVDIGRYGPYVKAGKSSCSLPKEMDVLKITFDEAVTLLKSNKKGSSSILKTLGSDENKNDVVIKNGRYGKFITNGKVNAPMPKNISVEELTLEEAITILSTRKPKRKKFTKK